MKIQVTAEDIRKGIPKKCTCCPISLAIKRATGRDNNVTPEYIRLLGDDLYPGIDCYWLSKEATQFVKNFDCGEYVEPFEFDLDVAVLTSDR